MVHASSRGVWGGVVRAAARVAAVCLAGATSTAQPTSVEHTPGSSTFGQAPGVTQREPDVPREEEGVDLFLRVSFQFTYDRVCVYYTTDGSEPTGSFGTPGGTTQVLRNDLGSVAFLYNEIAGGTRDWWRATLPPGTRAYQQAIRYKLSAWQQFSGPEVFANFGLAYAYANKLAWPGAGAGQPNPNAGYPPVSFWKEEAVVGNQYCAAQIDQNGTVYDFHFPTVGGVYGVGTRNEGYVDGLDTFPPGLPTGWRGQMHLNQAMAGIRIDGLTHWLSNPNAVSYAGVQQAYVDRTNTVRTTQFRSGPGATISIEQLDFSPRGITFPLDAGGSAQRHLYVKRLILTNAGPMPKDVNVYWYVDPALNGGDGHDAMFVDGATGAMVAYDNTHRVVTGTGTGFSPPNEYNPTTSPGYEKDRSLYLACAMKVAGGAVAVDSWRDTSPDDSQGWIGLRVTLPVNTPVEVDVLMAGAADGFAGATGTYLFQLQPAVTAFQSGFLGSAQAWQSQTDAWWGAWLDAGTTVDTPDDRYDALMERGLLATALHVDAVNGGVIAGFHNGAYPYVWPRDAVYAAVTLARTGHLAESAGVYRWMRDVCHRDFEGWGRKGFWKQKYSTDGYVIWGAPQIDETAVFPWGVASHHAMTADDSFLASYVEQVRDSVLACSQTSTVDPSRLFVSFGLMHSNNVWEDSYDTFVYSNANVVRGLRDAASIFAALGIPAEAADATARADAIKAALDARLDWDGENTDVSQLGIVYPFGVYDADDPRAARIADRINGVRTKFNNTHCCPEALVNFSGEHQGTINRYFGDGYWNGGPWFLSTLWYGLYYGERQDTTPGRADIDNHKQRMDLMLDRLGPSGLGAEQIAYATGPGASLLYPGQGDFVLQTAWPNAWESMSTLVDGVMKFLDYAPDAPGNRMAFEPKLPSAWVGAGVAFKNVVLVHTPTGRTHSVDVRVVEGARVVSHEFTNNAGHALDVSTVLRTDPARCLAGVSVDGAGVAYSLDPATGRVSLASPAALNTGAGAVTTVRASYCWSDVDDGSASGSPDGSVDIADLLYYLGLFDAGDPGADADDGSGLGVPDGGVDISDLLFYLSCFDGGCV